MRFFAPLVLIAAFFFTTSATAVEASITDRLSPNSAAVEITSVPTGAAYINVAVMKNVAGEGTSYPWPKLAATTKTYTPPASDPVVSLEALNSKMQPIGSWTSRLVTVPGGTKEEKEKPKEEPPVEEEKPVEEIKPGSMWVGVDAGGWDWASAVKDFSGAVKYVRATYSYYDSASQMNLLAENGVTLLPLFTEANPTAVVNFFKTYGYGGSYWAGKPVDLGAKTAEIINEPGNPYEHSPIYSASSYDKILTEVHTALEVLPAADRPEILASMDGGYAGDSYGKELIAADPSITKIVGCWTEHPYGGRGSRAQASLGSRARVTEGYAITHQPQCVTEVGWATGEEAPASLAYTEAEQAANIESFVKWAHGLGYVQLVVDFNYADYSGNNYGIVNSAGTAHKLSYAALHAVSSE